MAERMRALGLLSLLLFVGCERLTPPPYNDDWRFATRFEVRGGKLRDDEFQVLLPYEIGRINGGPLSDTYLSPTFKSRSDLEFDLNEGHARLLADLAKFQPTEPEDFRHALEPVEARIARLSPVVTNRRFKRIGDSQWVDGDTGRPLILAYFDRPARLHGNGFDVSAAEAGYIWIELQPAPGIARAIPRPRNLRLHFYRETPWWSDKVSIRVGY